MSQASGQDYDTASHAGFAGWGLEDYDDLQEELFTAISTLVTNRA